MKPPRLSRRSTAHSRIGVAIALYAFIAIGSAEGGLGVLLPSIWTTYGISPATVTLLFISQITGYVVAAFSSSVISQRLGLARMLLVAALTLAIALLTYALSPVWSVMVIAGTLLGLGIGLIDAGINTYIASDQQNATLMGVLHGFYGIGALLGPTIATFLLSADWNWRSIYLVFASIVGLLAIAALWAVVTNYRPLTKPIATDDHPNAWSSLRQVVRTPVVLVMGLLLLVYVGTEASIGNWAYAVQTIGRDLPTQTAGYSVSAYWLGLTIGRFALGQFVARLGAVRVVTLSLLLLLIGLLCWWQLPQVWLSLPLIGFALAAIFPTTIWLVPQRVAPAIVPAAIGLITSVASLGAAIIPTSVGWIADRAGLEQIPALMLLLAIGLLALHAWLVQRPAKSLP
ncbi:MFS transporter [Microcoleus sp. FACHB-1515]|uniref:MFS transporter n=1 Tax=Cyanophyceae TaxID=3028117 RepID=UPI0016879A44|nr:MFS transporter [Microcoleus sp. FACHB-1515]MBD2089016.1 MFS transporter [Microcoleus sp. FACHB-1515]